MTEFKKSLLLTVSICGCIAAPFMVLSFPFSHLSATSKFAREFSIYYASAGILIFILSIYSLITLSRSGELSIRRKRNAKICRYAIASIILGIPIFGAMTWGFTSLCGIFCGFIALRSISKNQNLKGNSIAIAGIGVSFAIFPILITMLFFLGP
jgi:hypothetical protein